MRSELKQTDWDLELCRKYDVSMQWTYVKDKIKGVIGKHIPTRIIKWGKRNKCPINAKLNEVMRKKHREWERFRESNYSDEDKHRAYCKLRNKVWKATRYQQRWKEKEVADNARTNPKKLWQYINRRTKTTTGIADLGTASSELTRDYAEKAEVLAVFSCSVIMKKNVERIRTVQGSDVKDVLAQYTITQEEVRKKLSKLNPSKSPGSDNINQRAKGGEQCS